MGFLCTCVRVCVSYLYVSFFNVAAIPTDYEPDPVQYTNKKKKIQYLSASEKK